MGIKLIDDLHAQLAIARSMGVRREEYLDYMTFKSNQRPLFIEPFGPIVGLKDEWKAQGATPQELDMSAFRYRQALTSGIPVNTGWMGGADEQVLEDTPEYIIARDRYGRRIKLTRGYATVPLPLDFPVHTMDDWKAIKHHYEFSEERFTPGWEQVARQRLAEGYVVTVSIPGGFDETRELMGDADLCIAYYEQPELVHDILDTIAETAYRVLDRVTSMVQVDMLNVHEDMAGRSGPLIGPRQMKEFVTPYYRRAWDLVRSRGTRLFMCDTDGNVDAIIPDLIAGGVNLLWPMEPAAGMDIVTVRQQYGTQLAFLGGIDKHVIRRSREEIVAELEYKIPPMVRSGGCVLGLDHRIPNGTPLANYRFYVEKAWEILDREAAKL
jgi:hypothetical protein